jgi:hypothetical protein
VSVRKVADGSGPASAPTNTASAPAAAGVPATRGGERAMVDETVGATYPSGGAA